MPAMTTLREALVDEVRDLYHAEQQLVKTLPKIAKAAHSPDLRAAVESHLDETKHHVSRLEQVFALLDEEPQGKRCAGMAGILEEGSEVLGNNSPEAVADACIIAAAQRAEHYEIAAYGTAVAWAEGMGLSEVADVLRETMDEEKAADRKLTELAASGINDAATADGNGAMRDEGGARPSSAAGPRQSRGSRR